MCITVVLLLLINSVVTFTEYCGETPDKLEKSLQTGHWVPQSVHYDIKIIPNDVERTDQGYIESWTTIRTVLTKISSTDMTKDVLNCTLSYPSYRIAQFDKFSKIPHSNTSGYFIYATSSLQDFYSVSGIFSVPTGVLSTVKATYSIKLARPMAANYTVLTGFPLTKTEKMTDRPDWVLETFESTTALWPKQVLVVAANLNGKHTNKFDFQEGGKNISITVAEPIFDDETQMCIARTNANILDYLRKLFKDDNKLINYNLVHSHTGRYGFRDGIHNLAFYGFILYRDDDIGEIAKKQLCSTPLVSDWRLRDMIISGVQQWLRFLGPERSNLYALQRGLTIYLVDSTVYEFTGDMPSPDGITFTLRGSSYDRARWIFKMLEGVFSKETFQRGLIDNFLAHVNNPNKSTGISDMFTALEKSLKTDNKTQLLPTGVSVKDIFKNWFFSKRHPRIRVGLSNINTMQLIISQEINGLRRQRIKNNQGFWIPVEVVTESQSHFMWLAPSGENVTVPLSKSLTVTHFFRVNPNITGWFEIWYDKSITSVCSGLLE